MESLETIEVGRMYVVSLCTNYVIWEWDVREWSKRQVLVHLVYLYSKNFSFIYLWSFQCIEFLQMQCQQYREKISAGQSEFNAFEIIDLFNGSVASFISYGITLFEVKIIVVKFKRIFIGRKAKRIQDISPPTERFLAKICICKDFICFLRIQAQNLRSFQIC